MKNYYFLGLLFSILSLSAQVGINTNEPRTSLDVNGETTIRKTNYLKGTLSPLYVDQNGLVGLKEDTGTNLTTAVFYAEGDRQVVVPTANIFNDGTTFQLYVKPEDIQQNSIDVTQSGNFFKVNKKGIYEITGFINFLIDTELNNNTFIVVAIDISTNNGAT